MDCKEHLIYFFLQGKISLSQYDQKFLSNLQLMVHRDNRVTSNQAELFDKLISKYSRQLSKNSLDKETLKQLPWKAEVVESSPQYTGARVSLVEDTINLRVPFNKNFISEFRDVKHNSFEWQRNDKIYASKFTTHALKILKDNLHKYFPTVSYCEQLQPILDELKKYDAEIWNPTFMYVHGRPMLVALNSILGDLVSSLELKNDIKTMFKLSQLGITIHPSLIVDAKTKFAAEFVTEVDLDELPMIIGWLEELNVGKAIMGRGLVLNKPIKQHISALLENHKVRDPSGLTERPILLQYHNQPDTRAFYANEAISKCVIIKNSRPIEVR